MTKNISAPLILAAVIASFLLFPFLNTIPGLHGDEAWVGLRAHEILHGTAPIIGMNDYTGPFHQYLVAPILWCFGYSVWALRLLTGIASVGCVILYHKIVARLFGNRAADIAVLVLVTMPFFALYGRTAWEVCTLNPILALAAIYLMLKSEELSMKSRRVCLVLAGGLLGMGVWNHIIFIAVPISLLAVGIVRLRSEKSCGAITLWAALGFCAVMALRIVLPYFVPDLGNANGSMPDKSHSYTAEAIKQRIAEWPGLLMKIAHGDILYQRFAGEVKWSSPNILAIILIVALVAGVASIWKTKKGIGQNGIAVIVFGLGIFITTLIISPKNSDRYFLLVLYLIPLAVAIGFQKIDALFNGGNRLATTLVGALMIFQLARTTENYFVSQKETGGISAEFKLGSKPETSNHFMRSDRLYDFLVANGKNRIYAESLVARPLLYYDLPNHKFSEVQIVNYRTNVFVTDESLIKGSCAVIYAEGIRRMNRRWVSTFRETYHDAHFILLEPGENVSPFSGKTNMDLP